jgi:hypothetical protein
VVRARQGAPLVKGNSYGIEINVIGHVRASDVMRSAQSSDARQRDRPARAKFEKASAGDDRKSSGLTGWMLGN